MREREKERFCKETDIAWIVFDEQKYTILGAFFHYYILLCAIHIFSMQSENCICGKE